MSGKWIGTVGKFARGYWVMGMSGRRMVAEGGYERVVRLNGRRV